jgi:O-antigen ligase
MNRAAAAVDRRVAPAWPALGALGACIITGAALVVIGPIVGLAVVGLLVILLLIRRPGIGLAVLLVSTVVFEDDPFGFLPITARFYEGPPSINEVVMATAAVGVLLDLGIRHRLPILPEPFTLPLALLGLAFVAGTVNGHFQQGDFSEVLWVIRPIGYMVLVSFLVVNLLGDRRKVWLFAAGAALLAVFKGIEGMVFWVIGTGRPLEEGGAFAGTVLTYYEPTANFLMLLFLLAGAGALMMRVPLPLWIKLTSPVVLAALVLAFRRNFWIALCLGFVLTIMLTSGIRGRRLVFPTMIVLLASIWIAIAAGGVSYVQGPLVERAQTLAPTKLDARKQDAYRLQEVKNVLLELKNHPIAGLGLGVPWSAVDNPLPEEHDGGRFYTHVVVLHYWLKFGLLGLAAYLWLMAVAILTAIRIWRFSDGDWFKVAGLATATGLVGLMVAETTGSYTGVDYRFSVIMGAVIGWLAAARMYAIPSRTLPSAPTPADPAG